MRILAIETSCDETSVAILSFSNDRVRILFHEISSQIPIHARYGGVVPEVAARTHVAEVLSLFERARAFDGRSLGSARDAGSSSRRFDAIAVTQGPGLATALRVGIEAARTIAFATGVPIVGVNHLEGHLASAWLIQENRRRWKFPLLALLVSGGHTELVLMRDFCRYRVLGRTRDDAAGEAFDKSAKLMGLGYPGGPIISQLAVDGNPRAFPFPRPMLKDPSLDFSFSGLKTDVRRTWEKVMSSPRKRGSSINEIPGLDSRLRGNDKRQLLIPHFCASLQEAIVETLVAKTIRAAIKVKPAAVTIVGGVSANRHLHEVMQKELRRAIPSVKLLAPATGLHTDNAAMIAAAGYWRLRRGEKSDWRRLDAKPEWDL